MLKVCFFEGEFLNKFTEAVTAHKMADVPLVFITYALSRVPPEPMVSSKFLGIVRYCKNKPSIHLNILTLLQRASVDMFRHPFYPHAVSDPVFSADYSC